MTTEDLNQIVTRGDLERLYNRLINDIGKVISNNLNTLLTHHGNELPAKVKIRAEFRRMGLKQNSRGIWMLSGLGAIDTYPVKSQILNVAITE